MANNKNKFNKNQKEVDSKSTNSFKGDKKDEVTKPQQTKRGKRNDSGTSTNHDDWLGPTAQLIDDAGRYPFSSPLGNIISLDSELGVNLPNRAIPGVMSLGIHPGIGFAEDEVSPVNVAARQIYSYVRHTNSGSKNYDAPDLMLYIISMSQAYALWAFMRRLYGALNMYTPINKYYPRVLVESMNCNYNDFLYHIADLRSYVNNFGYRLNQFAVPATMPYFSRMVWYFDHIYVDSQAAKAQSYLFYPKGFYKFKLNEDTSAGELEYKPFTRSGNLDLRISYEYLVNYADDLLNRILEQEDMGIMSGDILKAYSGKVFVVPETPDSYLSLPVYDPNALSMIQNASIMGPCIDDSITQDVSIGGGYLIAKPKFYSKTFERDAGSVLANNRLVSLNVESPDAKQVLRATLLTNVLENKDASFNFYSTSLSTSWVEDARIYFRSRDYDENSILEDYYLLVNSMAMDSFSIYATNGESIAFNGGPLAVAALFSRFKMHPCIYLAMDGTKAPTEWMMEVETYNVFTARDLYKLHDCIALGEFRVPGATG